MFKQKKKNEYAIENFMSIHCLISHIAMKPNIKEIERDIK